MESWLETAAAWLTLAVLLLGWLGLIVPLFPGIIVMWLATLGYGIISGFGRIGIAIFILVTLIMIGSTVIDEVFVGIGARQGGAPWKTVVLALLAGVVGTIALPPFGGLIAAPLAALALERRRTGDWKQAWQTVRGLAAGWGFSFIVRFGLGLLILGLWGIWALLE